GDGVAVGDGVDVGSGTCTRIAGSSAADASTATVATSETPRIATLTPAAMRVRRLRRFTRLTNEGCAALCSSTSNQPCFALRPQGILRQFGAWCQCQPAVVGPIRRQSF